MRNNPRKKWYRTIIIAAALMLVAGCASSPQPLDIESISVYDISTPPEAKLIEQHVNNTAAEPLVIKIPKGYNLAIHLNIDTPLAKLDSDAGKLHFVRDLYVYLDKEMVLVSPDKRSWAPFSDMEMVKTLFGADKGSVSLGMSARKDDGAMLMLSVIMTTALAGN